MDTEKSYSNQDKQQKTEAEKVLGNMPSFEGRAQDDVEKPRRKTFEEKAREKGYFKKDGIWMKHDDYGFNEQTGCFEPGYGDGSDEPVKWFKLDEEYPDLADKTEALAEQYHVKYDDYGGLKEVVYKNADRLSAVGDKHLENIFAIASCISFSTGGTANILVGYNSDELSKIYEFLDEFYSATASMMPGGRLDRGIVYIAEYFVRNYNPKLVEGDFLDKLSEYSAKAFQDDKDGHLLIRGIKYGIEGIGENEGSGKFFGQYMGYANELVGDKEKISEYDTKFDVLVGYVRSHGANEKTVSGFRDVVFPLMEQGDVEVDAIMRGGNAYGTVVGAYGIADYAEECLLSNYHPSDIDKLIRIYHEIPTSDYRRFEQNRKDAARLQGTIIGGRDFIHDERIGTNEVLSAIKDYYDNRDSEEADSYKRKLETLEEKYLFGVLPNALNLEMYEKPIEYMSDHNVADKGSPDERAIDILNRLVENTRPNLLEAPMTKYPELNELMRGIVPLINEQTGEVRVDFNRVGTAVAKMNEILLQNKGKQGIYPSIISAIAFLDKMSVYALRGIDKKDLRELPFDPKFKEMVRFSQLTSSMEYNENDFENKYRQIVKKFSEAYGDDNIDSSKIVEGYQMLSQQILKNVQGLSKNYASKSVTARFSDAVWSGNLSDELIGLFDKV